ncbi:glycosyltransferase family 2 protein [Haloglomus halophilum]|uniref:glycosyltransferase family 2 protein n=1 Tax=Haloglomus halophilum TaxID=2962672 RepID=UPI0020C9D2BD|nr:glycosyltransferase family 2 protein [Haloglomus halophilum]
MTDDEREHRTDGASGNGRDTGDARDVGDEEDHRPRYRGLTQRVAAAAPGTALERLRDWLPTPARADAFPVSVQRRGAFSPDRLLASLFVLLGTGGILLALGYARILTFPAPLRGWALWAVYVGLWAFVGIYAIATCIWSVEALVARRYDPPPLVYGPEDVQVRILTIAAEDVVQTTVDALPERLDDRHVIAEDPIEVDGATVHVVPDGFACEATDKGRALEWARRNVACDREWVLFLDEDTIVTDFPGLPDADIAQFQEWPMYTGSLVTYWAEVLRMGYQTELRAFARLSVPLYAWGGGIAVRQSVEDDVTWNYETLIEDTVFAWLATEQGYDYEVLDTKFRNQAPPSLGEMVAQRRRWISGSLAREDLLPLPYRVLYVLRNVAWAFSPLSPFLVAFAGLLPETVPGVGPLRALGVAMLLFTFVWVWRGWRYYEGPSLRTLPVFLLNPVVVALHSLGAAYGLVSPAEEFQATEKE